LKESSYTIRAARAGDLKALPQIEREAASMFDALCSELGMPTSGSEEVNTIETFREALRQKRLWVAIDSDSREVGFALALEIDGNAHLEELDVLPTHGRRGVGSKLVETVCAWATEMGYPCVTLSTFREIPWNRPFYEKRGFCVVEPMEYSPGIRDIVRIEESAGLNTSLRVVMRRTL